MKSRSLLVHLAFAFVMLLSQQLGIAHEITHLGAPPSSGVVRGKKLPPEMQCSQCLAFAAIGAALHGAPAPFLPVVSLRRVSVAATVVRPVLRRTRLFNPRAPPARL